VLVRLPALNFVDDKAGKQVGTNSPIGLRPIAAFGNSVGDQQMLEWTQAGSGTRLMMLVHHDDAKREWAYGVESKIGTFSDALSAGPYRLPLRSVSYWGYASLGGNDMLTASESGMWALTVRIRKTGGDHYRIQHAATRHIRETLR
jgi:hypothetical protein